jgi:hypothetical protein
LGCLNTCRQNGTPELVLSDGHFRTVPTNEARRADEQLLGYLEPVPFALLDPIHVARHRVTGQQVLVSGDDDPLLTDVDLIAHLGFVEPYPLRPRGGLQGTHEAAVIRELARLQPFGHDSGSDRRVAHRIAVRLAKYPTVYSIARRAYRLTTSPDRDERSS